MLPSSFPPRGYNKPQHEFEGDVDKKIKECYWLRDSCKQNRWTSKCLTLNSKRALFIWQQGTFNLNSEKKGRGVLIMFPPAWLGCEVYFHSNVWCKQDKSQVV